MGLCLQLWLTAARRFITGEIKGNTVREFQALQLNKALPDVMTGVHKRAIVEEMFSYCETIPRLSRT